MNNNELKVIIGILVALFILTFLTLIGRVSDSVQKTVLIEKGHGEYNQITGNFQLKTNCFQHKTP